MFVEHSIQVNPIECNALFTNSNGSQTGAYFSFEHSSAHAAVVCGLIGPEITGNELRHKFDTSLTHYLVPGGCQVLSSHYK